MSVIHRNINIPLFIKIEQNSLGNIQHVLAEHHLNFHKPLIITSEGVLKRGGSDVVHALGDPAIELIKENSVLEGNRITTEIKAKRNDVIVGVGGGRILDLAKYVATKAQINYVSVPTSPSNDGICSPVAVLRNEEGVTESIGVNMPIGILVDSAIMTSAPLQNVLSGVGDVISNLSSIADWKLAYAVQGDAIDDFAASISYSAAQLIFETCRGTEIDLLSTNFLEKLTHGLILSGIAMNIAGSSRPCSGSEHEISHAIDHLFPGKSTHGLQVAFATLLTTYLRGEDVQTLYDFYISIGLPIHHNDIGITQEELVEAIIYAPQTRPDRFTILEHKNLSHQEIKQLIEEFYEAYSR